VTASLLRKKKDLDETDGSAKDQADRIFPRRRMRLQTAQRCWGIAF
jgi:hypothetical protein